MTERDGRPGIAAPSNPSAGGARALAEARSGAIGTARGLDIPAHLAIPICRRRALLMIGGSLAAAAVLPATLAGCGPVPTAWVSTDVTPADLEEGQPVEVPFAGTTLSGQDLVGTAWLVVQGDGTVVAFDPRCTHQACEYDWAASADRFECACHEASFAMDGSVLHGPPPRPLAQFEVRATSGPIELAVPENFSTPIPGDQG